MFYKDFSDLSFWPVAVVRPSIPAVFSRRGAGQALEELAEEGRVGKVQFVGYPADRFVGVLEFHLYACDECAVNPFLGRSDVVADGDFEVAQLPFEYRGHPVRRERHGEVREERYAEDGEVVRDGCRADDCARPEIDQHAGVHVTVHQIEIARYFAAHDDSHAVVLDEEGDVLLPGQIIRVLQEIGCFSDNCRICALY